ncbi:sialoadhesin isoform X2 [Ctenopharyngodon idella]|uniref:sialoadhesin isoform X2 n=1 Tax=Ctenopharyngodon idella TaxID=7959 RepID=UPI002231B04C|nr:sialoadhesin isoform X2 [Ctenopharyngodon idella]
MELSSLPLMLLLISNIQPGQTKVLPETPKPVLTVQPEPSQIFRGETVTLTCDIQGEGWTYRWQCGDTAHTSEEKELKITVQIKQMCRCYSCRGSDCSKKSDAVILTVFDKPRVTVKPQSSVFTGDTVTLSCDVRRSTGLMITWYKNFVRLKSDAETETLRDVSLSDRGEYWCGVQRENKATTQGQRVKLTVRERPKAVVRVQPDGRAFRGQTVTLTCTIQETDVTSWSYTWKKDDSVIHESQSWEYRISSVNESHTGHYSCRGNETDGSRYSHTSDEVTLTLSDKPRVTVKPQSSVFTGDTVTLSCDVRRSTGLRIIWYKNFVILKSDAETETLRDVSLSDGGEYWCGVQRATTQGQRVKLTVRERPKAVVRVQPDGRVFRGQTVTFTCDIQETDVTSWSYTWKKDDSVIHESQSQEYRISSVNESHTGHYSCRGNETDGSRYSHTSDEVTLTLSGKRCTITSLQGSVEAEAVACRTVAWHRVAQGYSGYQRTRIIQPREQGTRRKSRIQKPGSNTQRTRQREQPATN